MLYIGYLIILDGQSIKNRFQKNPLIFELPGLENCMNTHTAPNPPPPTNKGVVTQVVCPLPPPPPLT